MANFFEEAKGIEILSINTKKLKEVLLKQASFKIFIYFSNT